MLKGLLSELLLGDIGVAIPTYVRNDNSTASYQVDAVSTVTNEKRLGGSPGSNRCELDKNSWSSVGYIPGDMNTSDGLTKTISSSNSRSLLTENSCRIVTEVKKAEIRKSSPAAKRYIVNHETIHGRKDLDKDMRRKTRVGRSSHWLIALGGNPPLNANKLRMVYNSKLQLQLQNRIGFYKRIKNTIKV